MTSLLCRTGVKLHECRALHCSEKWGSSTTISLALRRARLHGLQVGRQTKPRAVLRSPQGLPTPLRGAQHSLAEIVASSQT